MYRDGRLQLLALAVSCFVFAVPFPRAIGASQSPARAAVQSQLKQIAKATGSGQRAKLTRKLIFSIKATRDDALWAYAAWNLARLYRDLNDDAVLRAIVDAGLDAGPAETVFGLMRHFLEADPSFLRKNVEAERFVRSERPIPASMDELQRRCTEEEESIVRNASFLVKHGARLEPGLLRIASDPSAAITIDGKDTGLTTPIDAQDGLSLPPGTHRLTLSANGFATDFDLEVPADRGVCFYRVLNRH